MKVRKFFESANESDYLNFIQDFFSDFVDNLDSPVEFESDTYGSGKVLVSVSIPTKIRMNIGFRTSSISFSEGEVSEISKINDIHQVILRMKKINKYPFSFLIEVSKDIIETRFYFPSVDEEHDIQDITGSMINPNAFFRD